MEKKKFRSLNFRKIKGNILHKYLEPFELFDVRYDMFQHNVKHIVRLVEAKNKKLIFFLDRKRKTNTC